MGVEPTRALPPTGFYHALSEAEVPYVLPISSHPRGGGGEDSNFSSSHATNTFSTSLSDFP